MFGSDHYLFQTVNFEQVNNDKCIKKKNYAGLTQVHLSRFDKDSKSDDEIDTKLYSQLVALDLKTGRTAAEILSRTLHFTLRLDLIEV